MRLFHRKQKKNPAGTIVPKIVLTDQPDYQKARKYWNKLKQRLAGEIVLYQPDEKESLEVRVDADSTADGAAVWNESSGNQLVES